MHFSAFRKCSDNPPPPQFLLTLFLIVRRILRFQQEFSQQSMIPLVAILLCLSVTQSSFPKGGGNDSLGGRGMSEFNEHPFFDPGVRQHTAENWVLFVMFPVVTSVCSPAPFLFFFTCLLTFQSLPETFLGIPKHSYHSLNFCLSECRCKLILWET